MYTMLKLTCCLIMLLLVLVGCEQRGQEGQQGTQPTTPSEQTTPDTEGTEPTYEPEEPISTPSPGNGFGQQAQQMAQQAQQLQQRIQQDSQLAGVARNIQVQPRNGRLVLSGTVDNDQQRTRLEELAKQVAGNTVQVDVQARQNATHPGEPIPTP